MDNLDLWKDAGESRELMAFAHEDKVEPEVIKIHYFSELRPGDMIKEGVFIHSMHWAMHKLDRLTIATCCYRKVPAPIRGGYYNEPVWGEKIDFEPTFPVTVVRGALPPECND